MSTSFHRMQPNKHSHSRRRNPPPSLSPSPPPSLSRTRSGSSSRSLPAATHSTAASGRPIQRSQSTARPRSNGKDELHNNSTSRNPTGAQSFRKSTSSRGTDAQLDNYSNNKNEQTYARKTKSNAPSAWALSPGRFSVSTPPVHKLPYSTSSKLTKSPNSNSSKLKNFSDGAMNGVLKYFKPKRKVSHIQEEEFHHFRMANNALLQWRFVNARAKVVASKTKKVAEETLFDVWVKMSITRNKIVEKRKRVEMVKNCVKIMTVLSGQLRLLEEWGKIEAKNVEGVGRLTRKLEGISVRLPLIHGAKGDVMSIYDEMNVAINVMDDIQQFCTMFLSQLDNVCCIINELVLVLENLQEQSMEELNLWVSYISLLEGKEMSLRATLMQIRQVFRVQMSEPCTNMRSIPFSELGDEVIIHSSSYAS